MNDMDLSARRLRSFASLFFVEQGHTRACGKAVFGVDVLCDDDGMTGIAGAGAANKFRRHFANSCFAEESRRTPELRVSCNAPKCVPQETLRISQTSFIICTYKWMYSR